MAQIARARVLSLTEVNPDIICCDGVRRSIDSVAGNVVEVYLKSIKEYIIRCGYCGKITEIKGFRLVTKSGRDNIGVDFIDIDEGNVREV